jgi:hypothetical protein
MGGAGLVSALVAFGMRGQKEMNILPRLWGQVHRFGSRQIHLKGKGVGNNLAFKGLQAVHADHADGNREASRGKKPPFGESDVQGIL